MKQTSGHSVLNAGYLIDIHSQNIIRGTNVRKLRVALFPA